MKRLAMILAVHVLAVAAPARADNSRDNARELYSKKCLACHGADGAGDKPLGKKLHVPDLRKTKLSQAEIDKVITNGRGQMAPFKDRLMPTQIGAVAAYVKGGFK